MGAIADHYGKNEAPVLAVEAGADILLMPADPAGAIQAICEAVETGRIALERIQSSAERICKAKHRVCSPSLEAQTSHAWETILLPSVQLNHLAQPEAIATVRQILQDSMTTHHPPTSRLQHFQWLETAEQVDTFKTPNPFPLPLRNLILLDSTLNCSFLGRQAAAIALPAQFGYQLQVADCHTPNPLLNPESIPWQPTLLQLFIRGNPFRGSAGLTQIAQQWLEYLVKSNQLQALVIYGSPYVLEQFLPQLPHDLPYVFTYGQMPEAQAIALNALFTNSAFTSTVANGTDRLFTD
jgi:beta-glucosidase